MGYVSQFLRVIPRVPALEIVAEAARAAGLSADEARERAGRLLAHLNLPNGSGTCLPPPSRRRAAGA